MIPATIHLAVRSGAERLMFNAIKGAVRTENWICLHSFGLARHPSKRLGEIDFVLVTTHGLFVLEVKGGRTRRQGGVWIYTDRYDQEHRNNGGPFELVGIEDVNNEWWKAVCYVEMSRVHTWLYVLLTKDCEQIQK